MRAKWPLLAAGLFALAPASELAAQGARIAMVPVGGFALGYNLAEDSTYSFAIRGATFFGVGADITLAKVLGLSLSVLRTVGQPSIGKLELDSSGTALYRAPVAQTMLSGGLVLRPGGRTPAGAPTPLYIEIGGGLNAWTFGNLVRLTGQGVFPGDRYNASKPFGYAAAGVTLAVGPRAQVNLFARANYITAYASAGLDDFNALPPPLNVKGKTRPSFMAGVGLRVGR